MPVHRSKRSLMDIFADYSPKQMTNGQIRMECPFRENHEDGSGRISFFVSPDKNAYHCFSCNEHGNLVNLLTTKFEVGYFDAMELVTISDFEKKDSPEFELDLSWRLIPPEDFLKRGFKKETLKHFRIGLSVLVLSRYLSVPSAFCAVIHISVCIKCPVGNIDALQFILLIQVL